MKKELVEQAEMEQAYAVIGNLLDKSEDAEDLIAAVPVLAAKLSNDGGISWRQTRRSAALASTTQPCCRAVCGP